MMLRSNGRFFDFSEDIEVDKQSKLFEAIEDTMGDFSYQFELPRTSNNMAIFGQPLPDTIKIIYNSVYADILGDDNVPIYTGQIRVDYITATSIFCSFFSGNYNWIGLLSGYITEIDFSDLDTDLTEADIINNGVNTEGIFFPLLDTGGLVTRGSRNLVLKDFTGMIFVKTAFQRIFNDVGVKLQGDILTDPLYNTALISRLTVDQQSIDDRSSYVNKTSDQGYTPFSTPPLSTSPITVQILFQDDTTFPFFDGAEDNFASSRYTADVDMDVDVDVSIKADYTNSAASSGDIFEIKLFVDGLEVYKVRFTAPAPSPDFSVLSFKRNIRLDAGSYLEVFAYVDLATIPIPPDFPGVNFLAGSTVRVTPTFLFKTFGNSLLPNWTKAKFVNSVISLFCCICDYEPVSKTLTIDYFKGIKTKQPIDVSEYIEVHTEDTSEFISSFGKKSLLKYQDSDFDAIKEYNVRFTEPYGAGVIEVNNDFIASTVTVLESEFKAPVSYINPIFGASLERVNFVEMQTFGSEEFTSIQDSGTGTARLNMVDAGIFTRLDLCRIEDSNVPEYNGDWLITSVSTNFIVIDRPFSVTAVGTVTKIDHRYTNTEDVYIFIAVTYDEDNVSRFSNNTEYKLVENNYSNISYAFFNLLNLGLQINEDYKQSLAFGLVKNQLSYQHTLLETYWSNVDNILNDPVKLLADAGIPKNVFLQLTPLRPLRVRTKETDNLYYQNRIRGYKNSYTQCQVELIKLS